MIVMVYMLLLAGGSGTRMHSNIPKQFINLVDKPVIIHTLCRIEKYNLVDKIIVVCHADYINHMKMLLNQYKLSNVYVCEGGNSRLNSTLNGCNYIKEHFGINDDDIFLAHDSVRPFVSSNIILKNIKYAKEFGGATTAIPILETIQVLDSDEFIIDLLPREKLVSGQSPQTFNINEFMELEQIIPKEVSSKFTDLAEVYRYSNRDVKHVTGDRKNIKITTQYDMILAEMLLMNNDDVID